MQFKEVCFLELWYTLYYEHIPCSDDYEDTFCILPLLSFIKMHLDALPANSKFCICTLHSQTRIFVSCIALCFHRWSWPVTFCYTRTSGHSVPICASASLRSVSVCHILWLTCNTYHTHTHTCSFIYKDIKEYLSSSTNCLLLILLSNVRRKK